MAVAAITCAAVLYVTVRTAAYGVYCFKNTGKAGGAGVFVLAAAVLAAGYVAVSGFTL